MNYFNLINLCLQELNYKQVSDFGELVKSDHKRIKELVNRINSVIINSADWLFLQRTKDFELLPDTYLYPIDKIGRIDFITLDGLKLRYNPNYAAFLNQYEIASGFSIFNDKILFKASDKARNGTIYYYTSNCAKSTDGTEKLSLENADDETLLPDLSAQNAIIFGVCLQFKSNPEHPKFKYWLAMYNDAMSNLRSAQVLSGAHSPKIVINRGV